MRRIAWTCGLLIATASIAQDAPRAEKLRPYGEFRTHEFLAWHPRERQVMVRAATAPAGQVQLVMLAGADPQAIATLPGKATQAAFQPLLGRYVMVRQMGDDAAPRWVRVDLGSNAPIAVTPVNEVAGDGVWSRKGERFAHASFSENAKGARTALRVVDAANPPVMKLIATWPGRWESPAFSPDRRRLVLVESVSDTDRALWTVDLATGRKRRASPDAQLPSAYSHPQFSRDGRGVFALRARAGEARRLIHINLADGKEQVLAGQQVHEVAHLAVSHDIDFVAFTTLEYGGHVLRFLDMKSLKEQPRPPLFQGVIGRIQWRPGVAELAFEVTSARSAGDVFSYDVAGNRLARWTNGNNPFVNTSEFAEPRVLRWTTAEGKPAYGLLYMPPARHKGKRQVFVDLRNAPAPPRPGFMGQMNYVVNELGVAVLLAAVRPGEEMAPVLAALGAQPDIDASRSALDADATTDAAGVAELVKRLLLQ